VGSDKDACVYANVYAGFQVFLDGEVEKVLYFWVDVYGCEYIVNLFCPFFMLSLFLVERKFRGRNGENQREKMC